MQLFSADAIVFSKKNLNLFLTPKKWKNGPQKLLIISPNTFISHFSPDHSLQLRIDFSHYEISAPDICSLFCGKHPKTTHGRHFLGCWAFFPWSFHSIIKTQNLVKKIMDYKYFGVTNLLENNNNNIWLNKTILFLKNS